MMNRDLLKKDLKRFAALLTFITNCFIISGVIHHWKPREKPTIKNESWNNTYRYTNERIFHNNIHNNKEAGTHEVPHTHTIR